MNNNESIGCGTNFYTKPYDFEKETKFTERIEEITKKTLVFWKNAHLTNWRGDDQSYAISDFQGLKLIDELSDSKF